MFVLGLISGTSADGISTAVVRLGGAPPNLKWELLAHGDVPHAPELRAEIFASFRPETGTVDRLCSLNFALGRAFAAAARHAIAAAGLTPDQVDLIGSHGQTVWHIPDGPAASTLQLGEPAIIAELTGIPVVSNFRTRDMAAGGQGAPLASFLDRLLFAHPILTRALQNIGGIGNVTYLPPPQPSPAAAGAGALPLPCRDGGGGQGVGVGAGGEVAFDTGPGNMLMDYAAARITGGAWEYDRDGALAAQGKVDDAFLAELMAEPYLHLPPPKTTGRELFGVQFGAAAWEWAAARGLSGHDIIAAFTAFTARSIAQAYRDFLPRLPDEVIVSGGGAYNATLMALLRRELAPARVLTTAELGLPIAAKEAVAFAVMAYETWHGRPSNLPAATGARRAVVLGSITPGSKLQTANGKSQMPGTAGHAVANRKSLIRNPQSPISNLQYPITEARNPATADIDTLPTLEMARLINAEDKRVAEAVEAELPAIAEAIDRIAARMRRGGRLIYVGAGTSGRLGVLDASECPPTFSTPPEQVVALIAGGRRAITHAVEGAEDDDEAGGRDLAALDVGERDSVVGIAASGRTPYVLAAMEEAQRRGALVVSVACSQPSPMARLADIAIAPVVGPEVITGSTRLKAGAAQKMALNMLSTGVMIRLGKTFGNLMVDVQPTNAKLRARARRIVEEACGLPADEAAALLERCGGEVKTTIVAALATVPPEAARRRLAVAGGIVRQALADADHRYP
jgi:N-acetylmuramic acid 6-phosphate etherase